MLTQLQVLNIILSSGDISIITTRGLTVDYFPQFKNEFNFIYNHYKQYNQTPDITTFLKSFPDFEVIEVKESIDYLVSELYREKNEVFLADTFNKIKDLLMKDKTDEAMNLLSSAANVASSNKHLDAVNILEDISRYDEYVDKCNDFSRYYVSTGFKELDQIIGGWDRKEEYATISARSGVGKSWVLLKSITASIERGLNVGLFSGEMSVNKVGYRFDTLMSHLSNGRLMHGNADISVDYKKYLDDLKENHKGSLYVLTRDRIDGKATVDALRGFIEKYNLDILFIDQHSLLDSSGNERNSFEKAANISKEIKILQTIKHIPIITVSQQNRSSIEEGKFAGTENIANSDRIAQDSTVILFLSQKDDIMTIYIGKSRDGGTGRALNYTVNFDKGIWEYSPSEDEVSAKLFSNEPDPMNMVTQIDDDSYQF
jgi:replicative DNA helicase